MDRLICGDVGFGKTEVALRAAAAAALSGYQVAVVAPTTVLARQHLDDFARRFAGMGVRVAPLLRGAAGPAAREVRDGLADGSIAVVVGTQAIAAEAIRFKNLALVIIDEEQRFGDAHKKRLAALRSAEGVRAHAGDERHADTAHALQTAMVGLRAVSVIATPPVRRQPPRTFVLPWEPVTGARGAVEGACRRRPELRRLPPDRGPVGHPVRLAELAPELGRGGGAWQAAARHAGGAYGGLRRRARGRAAGDQHHRGGASTFRGPTRS